MPLYLVRFRETWVDVFHDVQDKGTRSSGVHTIKGTFPGCHVVFIVLENGTQVDPDSLDWVHTSVTLVSFKVGCKGNCPRACIGLLYSDCRAGGMSGTA